MSIFSFKGRIRRRDFWIYKFGMCILSYLIVQVLQLFLILDEESVSSIIICCVLIIFYYWIDFAICAKRCHDLGHNGFWQFIPFYIFWMAFQKGVSGYNKYGLDPKIESINNSTSAFSSPQNDQQGMKLCHRCGKVIPAISKICPYCKTVMYIKCPNCGTQYSSEYPACYECGVNKE